MRPPLPTRLSRRRALQSAAALGAGLNLGGAASAAHALQPQRMQFPRDFGAHTDFQTEWWYLTGFADVGTQTAALGFQITFFRSKVTSTHSLDGAMAAKHLLFAHAALSEVKTQSHLSDQRIARWSGRAPGTNGADLAWARQDDTGVLLRDWSLQREPDGRLRAQVQSDTFALDLRFDAPQPVLLQGRGGVSAKGPSAAQFSYYYSLPQLQVQGSIRMRGQRLALAAGSRAWLDHEWSDALLAPGAVGWDWIGINMLDGGALTAFQVRDAQGRALWDGGSYRAGSSLYPFARGEAVFEAQQFWRSPRSQARYPVQWLVRTPADFYTVNAVFSAQELDSRASTGALYWEGLCEVFDSQGRQAGRGYLEMTGYAAPLQL